jgi:hypothetical protein
MPRARSSRSSVYRSVMAALRFSRVSLERDLSGRVAPGYSRGSHSARLAGRLLPFLLRFLRTEPGILGQGSGHRCSVSHRFRATWPEPLPPRYRAWIRRVRFEPSRGNSRSGTTLLGRAFSFLRPLEANEDRS